MSSYLVLGFFDTTDGAEVARRDILRLGIAEGSVRVSDAAFGDTTSTTQTGTPSNRYKDKGFWASIADFFTLEPEGDRDSKFYAEGTRRGGVVLVVDSDEQHVGRVTDVMELAGAVNIEERVAEWRREGWQATGTTNSVRDMETAQTSPPPSSGAPIAMNRLHRPSVRVFRRPATAMDRPDAPVEHFPGRNAQGWNDKVGDPSTGAPIDSSNVPKTGV